MNEYMELPRDISAVLSQIETDAFLGENIDTSRVGVAGCPLVLPGEAGHFIRNHDAAAQAKIFEQVNQLAKAFFGEVL